MLPWLDRLPSVLCFHHQLFPFSGLTVSLPPSPQAPWEQNSDHPAPHWPRQGLNKCWAINELGTFFANSPIPFFVAVFFFLYFNNHWGKSTLLLSLITLLYQKHPDHSSRWILESFYQIYKTKSSAVGLHLIFKLTQGELWAKGKICLSLFFSFMNIFYTLLLSYLWLYYLKNILTVKLKFSEMKGGSHLGVAHTAAFLFLFFQTKPHWHRAPGQLSVNVVDLWPGTFWNQPFYEAGQDWLTHFENHSWQFSHTILPQTRSLLESFARLQFRVYLLSSFQCPLLTRCLLPTPGTHVLWTPCLLPPPFKEKSLEHISSSSNAHIFSC